MPFVAKARKGDFRKTLAEKEGITRWWFHPGSLGFIGDDYTTQL